MTNTEAVEAFLRLVVGNGQASERTYAAYRDSYAAFIAYCDTRIVPAEATRYNLEEYRAHLYAQGYAKATVAARLFGVRLLYRALVHAGLRADNPAADLKPAKDRTTAHDSVLAKALSPAEDDAFMGYLYSLPNLRDRAALLLMLRQGLRAEEVSSYRRSLDLDATGSTLLVHGKGGKLRVVGLRPDVSAALFALQEEAPFALSVRQLENITVGHLKAAGLHRPGRNCHALRHTYAVRARLEGANLEALGDSMGHANITTTHIYGRAAARYQDNPALLAPAARRLLA